MSAKLSAKTFYTRAASNEGITVPLVMPDGTESGATIKIRGMDSDAFRVAQNASKRRMAEFAAKCEAEKRKPTDREQSDFIEGERIKVLASLVIEWNLEEECNTENVENLLREAPVIGDTIDAIAGRRRHFFNKGLGNSRPVSEPNAS